jgi:ATP-dependent DNA ligase
MPHLVRALESMKLRPGWFDGEVVMLDEGGMTSFNALQNAFDNSRTQRIIFYLFDVPFYDGYDLRAVPVIERRAVLQSILAKPPASIRFSEAFDAMGMEGIIGKRKASRYTSRRSPDWIKLKCNKRQEFVIGGYTDPQGSRTGFGGLLVGYYNESGELVYAGKVGTGFGEKMLQDLHQRLQSLATNKRPFKDPLRTSDVRTGWPRSWWQKLSSPSGRQTGAFAIHLSRVFAQTSRRERSLENSLRHCGTTLRRRKRAQNLSQPPEPTITGPSATPIVRRPNTGSGRPGSTRP